MPMRSAKEAPPCFPGSQRRWRSSDEGLGERARKKLLGVSRRGTQAEGVTPTMFQRPLRVCTSLGVSKAVS
jgi:hypothetical protein